MGFFPYHLSITTFLILSVSVAEWLELERPPGHGKIAGLIPRSCSSHTYDLNIGISKLSRMLLSI